MDPDVRRRVFKLLLGMLGCAVVIALAVVLVVVIVERFVAPAGRDCRQDACAGTSVGDRVAGVRG